MKKTQPIRKDISPNSRVRRKKSSKGPVLLLCLILSLAAFFLARPLFTGKSPQPSESASRTSGLTESSGSETIQTSFSSSAWTEETFETTKKSLTTKDRSQALQAAGEEVIRLLENQEGRFGVFYMNLSGGEVWAYHDEDPFVAASSIKLGINTYLYSCVASGKAHLDDILTYDRRPYPTGDFEAGTGTVQNLPDKSQMTVREASRLSICISDNCATNMIIRYLDGIDVINEWLSEISGIVNYRTVVTYTDYAGQIQKGRHRSCARDLGLHAAELYRLWLENQDVYTPLIEDLCHTEFDFGIQKGIPEQIQVAHKIGTNGIYCAENDVGIVFCEEPFVLCVMTEMRSAEKAHNIEAEIAEIFYRRTGLWPWQ